MSYFNYHAKAKNKIKNNHLVAFKIVDNWNGIRPALVLFFDDNIPMPIRRHHWDEYLNLIEKYTKPN